MLVEDVIAAEATELGLFDGTFEREGERRSSRLERRFLEGFFVDAVEAGVLVKTKFLEILERIFVRGLFPGLWCLSGRLIISLVQLQYRHQVITRRVDLLLNLQVLNVLRYWFHQFFSRFLPG